MDQYKLKKKYFKINGIMYTFYSKTDIRKNYVSSTENKT